MTKHETVETLRRIEKTLNSVLGDISLLREELEEEASGKRGKLPVRVKLLLGIAKRGGSITREELHKIWKSFGRDPRGLGGFFKAENPLIADGAQDKIFLTKSGEQLLEEYLEDEK